MAFDFSKGTPITPSNSFDFSKGKTLDKTSLDRNDLLDPRTSLVEHYNSNKKESKLGNFLSKAGDISSTLLNAGGVGTGIGKGVISTVRGVTTLAEKGLRAATSFVPGVEPISAPTASEKLIPEELVTPEGTGEKIGYGAEKIAEFFLPGGLEKAAIGKVGEAIDTIKLANWAKNALKIGGSGGVTGVSTGAISAAQTGGKEVEGAFTAGLIGGALGKALDIFGTGLAKSIEESNFKLSPTQKAKVPKQIKQATNFIVDNGITGTESTKYKKLVDINDKLEETIQSSVNKNIVTRTENLIDELNKIPESFKNDKAIYQQVKRETQDAIKTLQETEGEVIDANTLLQGKRSYGKSAFGKANAQVKGNLVGSEGDYAIEQAYQNTLNKLMDESNTNISIPKELQKYFGGKSNISLPEFNKVYSDAINSKKFTNLAQFKRDTGLVGRLFGLWAGESVGQVIAPGLGGKIVGGMTGELLSSKLPSGIRNITQRAAMSKEKIVPITKVGLGTSNTP